MNAKYSNSRLNIISGKAMNLGLLKIRDVMPNLKIFCSCERNMKKAKIAKLYILGRNYTNAF